MKTRFASKADECSICFDCIEIQGKISCCSHLFCLKCIKKWSECKNSCPVCKARFSSIKKIPRRKEYKHAKNNIYNVEEKYQDRPINHTELLMLFQESESNSFSSEIQRIIELILRK